MFLIIETIYQILLGDFTHNFTIWTTKISKISFFTNIVCFYVFNHNKAIDSSQCDYLIILYKT